MIHAVKTIGDYVLSQNDGQVIDQLIDDPNDNGKYNTVLVILFEQTPTQLNYRQIEVEEYSRIKLGKYAYKAGTKRGGDYTPTSKITELEKTFARIIMPLKNICEAQLDESQDAKILQKLLLLLNDITISQKILADLAKMKYDDGAILTIAIEENKERKYVGDFPLFTLAISELFEQSLYSRKSFSKRERNSVGENNQCYICSQISEKTYGYAATYAFYTLDKPGFTSGGFQRENAWKNYPVCPDCGYTLELGRKYLESHLSARFCGLNYSLIPKSIFEESQIEQAEMFELLEDLEERKQFSLKKETVQQLGGAQDDLLLLTTAFDNFMNFNILFYDAPAGSSEFRILLYIEDVLPSYMQQIFTVKGEIENISLFRNLPGKEGTSFDLGFGFPLIANFFPVDKHLKSFLAITNSVFSQRRVSYRMLMLQFMHKLREKFRNNESIWLDVRKALMILFFLEKLQLLNNRKEGQVKMTLPLSTHEVQITEFFKQYSEFFNSDIKRTVFLEGVLAQKLLKIQQLKRDGATPFRARLNGLKLNEKIIKRLLPEMINKLEEYNSNYYHQIESYISKSVLTSDFSQLSSDELSFYFTVGMNLADQFKFEQKQKEDKGND